METIKVKASLPYSVTVGPEQLKTIGERARSLFPKAVRVMLVSDDTVFPLYGETVSRSLIAEGFETEPFVFPHGEKSKNSKTYLDLISAIARAGLSRSDFCVALGGGVVGDLTGFAAATYMRGIGFIQVPTTLLAMVDASVGGKTAVDLPEGKNLLGAFWQPSEVICDTDTLKTLPDPVYAAGCAEIVKYGCMMDKELFETLEQQDLKTVEEKVISRSVSDKRDIVEQDEHETGSTRILLNFGHTVGHAVEKVSNYQISHGSAVSIGMCVMVRAQSECGMIDKRTVKRIESLLASFALPTETGFSARDLSDAILSDKKKTGKTVNFVALREIGEAYVMPIPIGEIESFIEKGLKTCKSN